mmetsp:Transcript_17925/g.54830  ORF Transcript_17925/g.54830 Transcript_17925/m.54830 type:complete len:319 (+) Transcript_17925:1860-2816(+)
MMIRRRGGVVQGRFEEAFDGDGGGEGGPHAARVAREHGVVVAADRRRRNQSRPRRRQLREVRRAALLAQRRQSREGLPASTDASASVQELRELVLEVSARGVVVLLLVVGRSGGRRRRHQQGFGRALQLPERVLLLLTVTGRRVFLGVFLVLRSSVVVVGGVEDGLEALLGEAGGAGLGVFLRERGEHGLDDSSGRRFVDDEGGQSVGAVGLDAFRPVQKSGLGRRPVRRLEDAELRVREAFERREALRLCFRFRLFRDLALLSPFPRRAPRRLQRRLPRLHREPRRRFRERLGRLGGRFRQNFLDVDLRKFRQFLHV